MTSLKRPLVKFFGSKWTLAPHYPPPIHDTIIEPFAGGAGYSCRYPEKNVILCELNPDVANCWTWLISASVDEIMSLPVDVPIGTDIRTLDISGGAKELIRRWQRVGANTCWTISKWNNKPGQWSESVKLAIIESLPRIRHWQVICGSYESLPDVEATWFIDPVYQHVKGYGKEFERIDYSHLGLWCQSRKGQVVVCEQDGADWLPFDSFKELTCCRNRGKSNTHKSKEVVWLKGC
jgi:site-specific DNA-adenine methylase